LRVEPLAIGKVCTAIQVAYVALVLLFLALRVEEPRVIGAAALVVAAFTVASWLAYTGLWLKALAARYRSVA
jgi:phosphatidylglycerophosphate synthase